MNEWIALLTKFTEAIGPKQLHVSIHGYPCPFTFHVSEALLPARIPSEYSPARVPSGYSHPCSDCGREDLIYLAGGEAHGSDIQAPVRVLCESPDGCGSDQYEVWLTFQPPASSSQLHQWGRHKSLEHILTMTEQDLITQQSTYGNQDSQCKEIYQLIGFLNKLFDYLNEAVK